MQTARAILQLLLLVAVLARSTQAADCKTDGPAVVLNEGVVISNKLPSILPILVYTKFTDDGRKKIKIDSGDTHVLSQDTSVPALQHQHAGTKCYYYCPEKSNLKEVATPAAVCVLVRDEEPDDEDIKMKCSYKDKNLGTAVFQKEGEACHASHSPPGPKYDDCKRAYDNLNKNNASGQCAASNCGGTYCTTKAKHDSCEIKLCLTVVPGAPPVCGLTRYCQAIANKAIGIINREHKPGVPTIRNHREDLDTLTSVLVAKSDPDDGLPSNCGSPGNPC